MVFEKTHEKENSFRVRTTEFGETLVGLSQKWNDHWSEKVQGRILAVNLDLHGADVVYHKTCCCNFASGKSLPFKHAGNPTNRLQKQRGKKANMNQKQAFEEVLRFFETNDDKQLTARDLVNMMSEFLGDSEEPVYSQFYMKKFAKERFGDGAVIAETNSKASVVTLRPTAHTMPQNFYAQPNDSNKN